MSKKPTGSELRRSKKIADDDIDYSDIPELDQEFLDSVHMVVSPGKKAVSLRLDTDVLAWMKSQGKGYQSRINAVLRAYYEANRDQTG